MKKKIFLILIMVLFLKFTNIYALTYNGCDYSDISRIKSLVTNINISYDYKIIDNRAYFDVTITNMFPDAYFVDSSNSKTYTYNDTNDGEITIYNYQVSSGSYKFYSALDTCYGTSLGTKYYKFPTYNIYYNSSICSDVPNFSLCQKWANVNYSSNEFERLVNEYKEKLNKIDEEEKEIIDYEKTFLDRLVEIYVGNYYYFLAAIILVCLIIMIVTRRKNRFKL